MKLERHQPLPSTKPPTFTLSLDDREARHLFYWVIAREPQDGTPGSTLLHLFEGVIMHKAEAAVA